MVVAGCSPGARVSGIYRRSEVKRTNSWLLIAAVVVAMWGLLFGCSLLMRDPAGLQQRYIRLTIVDPSAAKAIHVSEHEVTEVQVALFAPGEETPFYELAWEADDDPISELIPVSEPGQYRIEVVHISDENGEPVVAEESATFEIEEMLITVIEIVPGCVGTMSTPGGGGQTQDPWEWLCDFWVQDQMTAPYVYCLEIREDGTWYMWERYDGTGGPDESGTWYAEGDLLYLGVDGMTIESEVLRPDPDQVIFVAMDPNPFYRRGKEPGGWVFDQTAIPLPLSMGDWTEGIISNNIMMLYSFQATDVGLYDISWKQVGDPDPPVYTAEIAVSAYREITYEPIFEWVDYDEAVDPPGYWTPISVDIDAGETIYIVVEGKDEAGNFGIRVMQQ